MENNTFLVDTSVWLLALRRDYIPKVKERIDYLLGENAVITTGIVKLQILGGTKTETEFKRLKSRFDALHSIETDTQLWEKAYDLAFTLRRKGVTVPYTAILIAACGLTSAATLVHADAHFDLIAKHTKLSVESFVKVVKKKR